MLDYKIEDVFDTGGLFGMSAFGLAFVDHHADVVDCADGEVCGMERDGGSALAWRWGIGWDRWYYIFWLNIELDVVVDIHGHRMGSCYCGC